MSGINPSEHGLSAEAKRERIANMTNLVAAWEKCKVRSVEVDRGEAARASSHLPRQMSKIEVHGTKNLFERLYFKVSEETEPAKAYVEMLNDRLQDGEYHAEHLTEVYLESPDDLGDDESLTIDRAISRFKMIRRRRKGTMPNDTEEYRATMKTMGIAWTYLRLKHNNRQ